MEQPILQPVYKTPAFGQMALMLQILLEMALLVLSVQKTMELKPSR